LGGLDKEDQVRMTISAQNLSIKGVAFSRVREASNAIGDSVHALSETTMDGQKHRLILGKVKA